MRGAGPGRHALTSSGWNRQHPYYSRSSLRALSANNWVGGGTQLTGCRIGGSLRRPAFCWAWYGPRGTLFRWRNRPHSWMDCVVMRVDSRRASSLLMALQHHRPKRARRGPFQRDVELELAAFPESQLALRPAIHRPDRRRRGRGRDGHLGTTNSRGEQRGLNGIAAWCVGRWQRMCVAQWVPVSNRSSARGA